MAIPGRTQSGYVPRWLASYSVYAASHLAVTVLLSLQLSSSLASRPEERLLMGLRSSNLTAALAYNPHPIFARQHPVSLHIIIPSVGRHTIFRLLESLQPQLEPQDYVTVAFDGEDRHQVFERVQAMLADMPGSNEAIMEPEAVHDFGNNLRSKHRSRAGEFTMFADDDNLYAPDALPTVRTVVHHDSDALYVFQLMKVDGSTLPSLYSGEVEGGNVDSGCGVVPTKHAHLADWTPGNYMADGDYFHSLSEQLPRTYLIPKVIYLYTGAHSGGEV